MSITGEYPTVYVNMLIRDYCWSPPFLSFDFCKVDEDSPGQDPVENLGQVSSCQHGFHRLHCLPLVLGGVRGKD